jgi:DNA-binding MarR family transcriptional regulator
MKRISTMSPAAANLDLDQFLPYLMNVLANRLSRELAGVYEARFGISIPEWRVIAHLSQHEDVSVREIHQRVDMDKAKVSRAAARLEAVGFIEKTDNESDRRLVALRLTRKGRRLFAEIEPLALAYERESLSTLSKSEEATLRSLLNKLLGAADRGTKLMAMQQRPSSR